jgi:hypothetical protein
MDINDHRNTHKPIKNVFKLAWAQKYENKIILNVHKTQKKLWKAMSKLNSKHQK